MILIQVCRGQIPQVLFFWSDKVFYQSLCEPGTLKWPFNKESCWSLGNLSANGFIKSSPCIIIFTEQCLVLLKRQGW